MTQATDSQYFVAMQAWMQAHLDRLVVENGVPGAAAAIAVGDQVVEAASGLVNLRTSVPTTTESVFQIGSITKVVTATLVMQLVDDGRLDLDAPVCDYIPEFRTSDAAVSRAITARHLLTHTSGFLGDLFVDTGQGDDAITRLVALLKDVPQLSRPGDMFSYSNAGFVVLGRVIERLTERPYDEVLRDRLADPLGLETCSSSAEEAILQRAAVGHFPRAAGGPVEAAPFWSLPRSNTPAGAMLSMSARDLVRFARMHLRGGTAEDGTQILGKEAVASMQMPLVPAPYFVIPHARGLGWTVVDLPSGRMIGHDGGTVGQYAFVRAVPAADFAVVLLTNGGDSGASHRLFVQEAARTFGGVEYPATPVPSGAPMPDAERYLGTYECGLTKMRVRTNATGEMWVDATPQPVMAEIGAAFESFQVLPLREDVFLRAEMRNGVHDKFTFVGSDETGKARFLHNGRAHARASD